jgi:hypothetical protein
VTERVLAVLPNRRAGVVLGGRHAVRIAGSMDGSRPPNVVHNLASACKVFGEAFIERKRVLTKVHTALRSTGFREPELRRALAELEKTDIAPEPEPLLTAALALLAPAVVTRR